MLRCFSFRMCLECIQGQSFSATQSYAHLRDEIHGVKLDSNKIGSEVVLLKNGTRICGTGGSLGTAPIVQNKAFYQVHIQQTGVWGIGLANQSVMLSNVPIVANAWLVRNDGYLMADGEIVGKLDEPFKENEIVGVSYDHSELKFYKDNQPLSLSITGIKGQVYPLLYVDDNAILDVKFRLFDIKVPNGFEEIMIEQTLL